MIRAFVRRALRGRKGMKAPLDAGLRAVA